MPPQPSYVAAEGSPLAADPQILRRAAETDRRTVVESFVIPVRSGRAWEVPAGHVCRLSIVEGPQVLEDCRRRYPHGLPTGEAGWTTAGRLPARWVIHVVGPNRHRGETDPALLRSCYRRAIEVADGLGARAVAFSLVGAGVYGWSREESVRAALEAFDALTSGGTQVEEARLVAFGTSAHTEVERILRSHGAA